MLIFGCSTMTSVTVNYILNLRTPMLNVALFTICVKIGFGSLCYVIPVKLLFKNESLWYFGKYS